MPLQQKQVTINTGSTSFRHADTSLSHDFVGKGVLNSLLGVVTKVISHARTVDESQWERGKIDPPPAFQKPLNRWSPKFVWVTTSVTSTTKQNFIQIGLGVSVLRMRDFAPLGKN